MSSTVSLLSEIGLKAQIAALKTQLNEKDAKIVTLSMAFRASNKLLPADAKIKLADYEDDGGTL